MKLLIVLSAVLGLALADSLQEVPIVRSSYDITPEGSFQWGYETGNGIAAQSEGVVKNANSDSPALEIKGSFQYTSPDGVPVQVSYIANENGFQPQGDVLPVAPEIPAAIARSLEYIRTHPAPEVSPLQRSG